MSIFLQSHCGRRCGYLARFLLVIVIFFFVTGVLDAAFSLLARAVGGLIIKRFIILI
jgi:hypothetical protein